MAIIYNNQDTNYKLKHKRAISAWLKELVAYEDKRIGEVSIILCSDSYILEVNKEYLNHDYFTDIITFDYCEGEMIIGDLFISVDTVRSNAEEYGVLFHVELLRVIAHGVLHLMGYKDKSAEESKIMREKEDWALSLWSQKMIEW